MCWGLNLPPFENDEHITLFIHLPNMPCVWGMQKFIEQKPRGFTTRARHEEYRVMSTICTGPAPCNSNLGQEGLNPSYGLKSRTRLPRFHSSKDLISVYHLTRAWTCAVWQKMREDNQHPSRRYGFSSHGKNLKGQNQHRLNISLNPIGTGWRQ